MISCKLQGKSESIRSERGEDSKSLCFDSSVYTHVWRALCSRPAGGYGKERRMLLFSPCGSLNTSFAFCEDLERTPSEKG